MYTLSNQNRRQLRHKWMISRWIFLIRDVIWYWQRAIGTFKSSFLSWLGVGMGLEISPEHKELDWHGIGTVIFSFYLLEYFKVTFLVRGNPPPLKSATSVPPQKSVGMAVGVVPHFRWWSNHRQHTRLGLRFIFPNSPLEEECLNQKNKHKTRREWHPWRKYFFW